MKRRLFIVSGLATPFLATTAFGHSFGMDSPVSGAWRIDISKARQRADLFLNGNHLDEWLCSTARSGKVTPSGTFYPYWLSKNHKSSLYENFPMPNSVFYSGNFAIHGIHGGHNLGRRASNGCVRLSVHNSAFLFEIPRLHGLRNLQINIA